jgi:hypothetical protein
VKSTTVVKNTTPVVKNTTPVVKNTTPVVGLQCILRHTTRLAAAPPVFQPFLRVAFLCTRAPALLFEVTPLSPIYLAPLAAFAG